LITDGNKFKDNVICATPDVYFFNASSSKGDEAENKDENKSNMTTETSIHELNKDASNWTQFGDKSSIWEGPDANLNSSTQDFQKKDSKELGEKGDDKKENNKVNSSWNVNAEAFNPLSTSDSESAEAKLKNSPLNINASPFQPLVPESLKNVTKLKEVICIEDQNVGRIPCHESSSKTGAVDRNELETSTRSPKNLSLARIQSEEESSLLHGVNEKKPPLPPQQQQQKHQHNKIKRLKSNDSTSMDQDDSWDDLEKSKISKTTLNETNSSSIHCPNTKTSGWAFNATAKEWNPQNKFSHNNENSLNESKANSSRNQSLMCDASMFHLANQTIPTSKFNTTEEWKPQSNNHNSANDNNETSMVHEPNKTISESEFNATKEWEAKNKKNLDETQNETSMIHERNKSISISEFNATKEWEAQNKKNLDETRNETSMIHERNKSISMSEFNATKEWKPQNQKTSSDQTLNESREASGHNQTSSSEASMFHLTNKTIPTSAFNTTEEWKAPNESKIVLQKANAAQKINQEIEIEQKYCFNAIYFIEKIR
jgi:hypothetical protein